MPARELRVGCVCAIAPGATGAPITTAESGRIVVSAFVQAGILSLLAVVVLLAIALRNARDVVLTLGPLLAACALTFATCVVLGLPLNFANIIVLPLLLGIGVAFHIYFVMAWRAGGGVAGRRVGRPAVNRDLAALNRELEERADAGVYGAKRRGRNRVAVAPLP